MKNIILLSILYAGFVAQYTANKLLTRHLDLDGLGDFNVAVSVATICAVIFVFGGDAGSNHFIPQYLKDNEWKKIKGYIVYYLILALTISFFASIISLGADYFLRLHHLEKFLHESYFAMILTPAFAVFLFLGALLLSLHREYASSITTELAKPLLFVASLYIWLLLKPSINEYQAIVLLLASLMITVIVQSWLNLKSIPFNIFSQKPGMCIPEWNDVGKSMLMITLANNFVSIIDIWSLEIIHNNESSVGAFSLLVLICSIIWVNYNALYYLIASRISTNENDTQSLQRNYTNAVMWLLAINIPTTLLIIFYAEPILGWFDSDMVVYKNWLCFIAITTSVNSLLQLASPFLRFSGYARQDSIIARKVLLISFFSSPFLVFFFGIEGAIISSSAHLFIRGLWYSLRLKTLQGVSLV
ncbi:MAG TPA: hypothetical protein ENL07_10295 [Chlorobaculum parvum]|uniref:Polysaccharide biosynthesis protein n=1 Tax=Chlorobaculum parvum TaxID=274539 RepID=A0A7C5HK66_9CHLB|nr:hypothetical protein [Chlorobaculum parvum]